jgi:hypothetical protein
MNRMLQHGMLAALAYGLSSTFARAQLDDRANEEVAIQLLRKAREFLSSARDRGGSASRPYVGDVPAAVAALVVDKRGIVQATHNDALQDAVRLRAELDVLVKGKSIIEEIPDEADAQR